MDEMVTADGKTVAVAADLPDGEVRVGYLSSRGNGCRTAVDGLHSVCVDIIRQTA